MALSTRTYTTQDLLFIEAERKFYQQQMEGWIAANAAHAAAHPRSSDNDFAICSAILMATYAYGQTPIDPTMDRSTSTNPYLVALRQENERITQAKQFMARLDNGHETYAAPALPWWMRTLRWLGII